MGNPGTIGYNIAALIYLTAHLRIKLLIGVKYWEGGGQIFVPGLKKFDKFILRALRSRTAKKCVLICISWHFSNV